jgi:hypothetical protein
MLTFAASPLWLQAAWRDIAHRILALGRYSKQTGDESHLMENIPFAHVFHLSFSQHVHDLVSL